MPVVTSQICNPRVMKSLMFMMTVVVCLGYCHTLHISPDAPVEPLACTPVDVDTPMFVQLYPVHRGGIPNDGVWRLDDVTDTTFDAVLMSWMTANGVTIDSVIAYTTSEPLEQTRYLVAPSSVPVSGRYSVTVNGALKAFEITIRNRMITTTDVDDFDTLVTVLHSVDHITLFGIDSTIGGDALQYLIDECIQGDRIQYHIPIADAQRDSLMSLGWTLQDFTN